ncbi:MAG: hypothetical protein OER97_09820 [Gammaproteobacteria bacterium]|nr:hypothetical protein [Gammaproteobacteria bacterium]
METKLKQATLSGRRSILCVHGRGFKPSPEALMELTSSALRAGLERDFPDSVHVYDSVQCDLVYYGDLSNDLLTSLGGYYDEQLDIGDRKNALKALREIRERKRFGIRQYDRLPGKSALAEFAVAVSVTLLGALGLWMWLCARNSKDFAEYLTGNSDYADRARERVRMKLAGLLADGDQVLLITHGTGSAIAWDAMWELSHDENYSELVDGAKVDLWLTLGTPLGDAKLRKRLLGARQDGISRFPTNVISWQNVAAEDDYTCHDNTVADDFKKMMRERAVSVVNDYMIYNHAVRYGKSNPHSSIGYYIHPRVSKIVAEWLLSDEDVTAVASPNTPE